MEDQAMFREELNAIKNDIRNDIIRLKERIELRDKEINRMQDENNMDIQRVELGRHNLRRINRLLGRFAPQPTRHAPQPTRQAPQRRLREQPQRLRPRQEGDSDNSGDKD